MRARRSDRPTGPDDAPEAAGDADEATARTGAPLLAEVMTAETVPVMALLTLPAWRALAARLREREQDAADRAIADAIDAVTEVV